MIDFSDHNDAFLSLDVFAQEVEYIRRGYPSVVVAGIFENIDEQNMVLAGGSQYEATSPRIIVRTSDTPYMAHRDAFIVNGKTYLVIGLSADSGGITTVELSEESDV